MHDVSASHLQPASQAPIEYQTSHSNQQTSFPNQVPLNQQTVNLIPHNLIPNSSDGLLVKFKANTNVSSQRHALSASGLISIQRFELVPGLAHVKAVAGENILSTLASIQSDPNVEYAEPNYIVSIEQIPNDPKFDTQYGLYNTGQTGGSAAADISATDAWDITTGMDVIVAVIDTGVDYTHSELRSNMWVNVGEIVGNNIDDDNNGFVDDIYGWDFSTNTADPMDTMGHGTHVAGIIAAKGNNRIGIAGINWNARIMALKFIDANGLGVTSKAIKALNYAVAMGARVSNNSWGGGGFSQALYDAIAAAESAGHIFVAASGNKGLNTDDPINSIHYPSSYPMGNVISVTATDEFDLLGSFSNYGSVSVDLAAPGSKINSLWTNNSYMSLDGTSMAAPFVVGAVSLLWSENPQLSIFQIRSALLNNIDELPALNGLTTSGGRLNILKALRSVTVNINIIIPKDVVAVGDSITYRASGGTPPYSWSINNVVDNRVASINSQSGRLIANSAGVVQVVVKDAQGFTKLSSDLIIEKLIIEPEIAFLNVGEQLQYQMTGGLSPYRWVSSDPKIVSIDSSTGLLTAIASGQAQVTGTDANNISLSSGIIDVMFVPNLTVVQINKKLTVGESFQLNAVGGIFPYAWTSSDASIAAINATTGIATALSSGEVTFSVTDAVRNVATTDVAVQGLLISLQSITMKINEIQKLLITGGVEPYEWFVSNSFVANVVTDINGAGLLTALAQGSIKVSVRDANGLSASTEMILITDSIALTLSMDAGILIPNEQMNANVSGGILPYRWSSSNTAVLKPEPIQNKITAMGAGTAYITIKDGIGDVVSSAIIEVRDIKVISQRMSYFVGEKETLFSSGGVAPYAWQVDDVAIASVNKNGLFTAKAKGMVMVGVTDADGIRGETKRLSIMTNEVALHAIELTPRSVTLSKRSTSSITFVARGGVSPYIYRLSNKIGSINVDTGEFNPKSSVTGKTTVIVFDADGHSVESGVIEIK